MCMERIERMKRMQLSKFLPATCGLLRPRLKPRRQRRAGKGRAPVDWVIPGQELGKARARYAKGLGCCLVCVAHVGPPGSEVGRGHTP